MKFYNRSSIRTKLKLVILLTCIITIVLVFTGFYIYELITSRELIYNDLSTKASIISENINAALVFRDSSDASGVLSSLSSQPNIKGAAIFDKSGLLFAEYKKQNDIIFFPDEISKGDTYKFSDDELIGYEPVTLAGSRIGTIYLVMDLSEQNKRSSTYIKIALLFMLGILLIAYFVSAALAKNISAPIVALVNTAERITKNEDYTIRAEKQTNDETGLLVDSFNDMLDKIMERDKNIRQVNKTLQDAEKRYRTTLDNMLEGVQILGYDWKYLYLNDVALKQSRFPKEKLIGYAMWDVYPGIQNTELFFHMKNCMDKREPHIMENKFTYPDGSVSWYNLNIEPVPEGIFILSVDITEEKHLQEELKKYQEKLEELVKQRTLQLQEANNELQSFTYTVSHDLRAPVRHINGFLDILRNNIQNNLDEKNLRYFNLIKEAASDMGTLIDELLTFSRTARSELSFKNINMNDLVKNEIEKLTPDFEKRNINWNIHHLPDIKGDYQLMRVVVSNLISNAIKFTALKEEAKIEIGSKKNNQKNIFYVKDNGSGFDMKYYDKLFGVFQRLHSVTDFPGTGIGLATVKKIITKHYGEVWAESKEGEGASFYFSIPLEIHNEKSRF